jgi:hypothetical protein
VSAASQPATPTRGQPAKPPADKAKAAKEPRKKEAPVVAWRERLPARSRGLAPLTLGVLLRAVKEGCLPLDMFEPLTSLQRMSEMMEYAAVLDQAAAERDPVRRLGLVAAVVVGTYSGSRHRVHKPFNPLLGETFAMDRWEELGWRWMSEQIQHSPDVSAYHAEGRLGWSLWGVVRAGKPKPSLSYVSILPQGRCVVLLPCLGQGREKEKESYEYGLLESLLLSPASCDPANRRLEHVGTLRVRASTGLTAALHFTRGSLRVSGSICQGKTEKATLKGIWTESLHLHPPASGQPQSPRLTPLFNANALPSDAASFYGFRRLARQQHPPQPPQTLHIPPTDSRRRPDQRAFEDADFPRAQDLKRRLEAGQRRRKDQRRPAKPLWFSQASSNNNNDPLLSFSPNYSYWRHASAAFKDISFTNIFDVSSS